MTLNILTVDTATPQVTAGIVRVTDSAEKGPVNSENSSNRDGRPEVARQVETLATESHLDSRAHNEVLTPLILSSLTTAGLKAADLDAVVVGCGPGPFTGLRVGMATAASFADALDIPCYGVSTLDAIAAELAADSTTVVSAASEEAQKPKDILVVTDARRREVYYAAYRDEKCVFGPAVNKAAAVAQTVSAEVSGFTPQCLVGSPTHAQQVAEAWSHVSNASAASGEAAALGEAVVIAQYPTPAGLASAAGFADGTTPATPKPLVPLYLRRPDAVPPKQRPTSPAIPDIAAAIESDSDQQ